MSIVEAIQTVARGTDLSEGQAAAVAGHIMRGQATPAQIGGLLVGLRLKGETAEEICGFARAMRTVATPLPVCPNDVIDTCGTGGDGAGSFNVSTAAAIVAAAAGCRVAKHGNRSVSSRCGSADVLRELGVNVEASPHVTARCIQDIGIGFLFAPQYHAGARHAAAARREIGVRSVFNILGPLSNPAGARRQLIGVFDPHLARTMAEVLRRLGSTHCLVVHGADGLDEISLSGPTHACELKKGEIVDHRFGPEAFGLPRQPLDAVRGGDAAQNAAAIRSVLAGRDGALRDIVLLNAGAAIYVAGRADTIADGMKLARRAIDDHRAERTLEQLVQATNESR
jgi:anthranilate phosphoribosyltransferase